MIQIRNKPAVAILALSFVVAGGGMAIATIPGQDGGVTLCFNNATQLGRIIDTDATERSPGQKCTAFERTVKFASFNGRAGGDLAGTFPNPTLAPNAVGNTDIANNAVTSSKIAAGAVRTVDLATGSVDAGVLKPGAAGYTIWGRGFLGQSTPDMVFYGHLQIRHFDGDQSGFTDARVSASYPAPLTFSAIQPIIYHATQPEPARCQVTSEFGFSTFGAQPSTLCIRVRGGLHKDGWKQLRVVEENRYGFTLGLADQDYGDESAVSVSVEWSVSS